MTIKIYDDKNYMVTLYDDKIYDDKIYDDKNI